jgi:DNA-binding NarL/FixJ family response regulator
MSRARILLADDHRLVAEGVKTLLTAEFDLVGIVEDGPALIAATKSLRPDVIVSDITMPNLNGIEALKELKGIDPGVRMIFLTMHREVIYACRALKAGACGYVLKHSAPKDLIMAIRAALEGRTFITPLIADEVLEAMRQDGSQVVDQAASLTLRQSQVLRLMAEGLSGKQIALQLGISTRTVEFHKYRIMEALGASTSNDLIHFAIKHGFVDP